MMNITEILQQFEQIQNWGNAALTAVCCLGMGYVWRMMKFKWFPNDAIPAVVCMTGIGLFVAFSGHDKQQPDWSYHFRAGAVGFVIGFIVVIAHNFAISKLEDWLSTRFGAGKTDKVPLLLGLFSVAAMTSCAQFSTKQTDYSYDKDATKPSRAVTTHAKAWTFFSAKSELAKFKASQTDKTQGASVGSLNQSAESTNATSIINGVVEAAVRGAVAASSKQ